MTPATLALLLTMPVTPVKYLAAVDRSPASYEVIASTISTVEYRPNHRVPEIEEVRGHIQLNDDNGGDLDAYARAFDLLALVGDEIWVTGQCLSACTLVLKNPKACAMPNAVFGFHAARNYNPETMEMFGESARGNRIMWEHYPDRVKLRLGGRLSAKVVVIKGTDLLPPCK